MIDRTDDRPAPPADGKPFAEVRLDAELMNALAASQGRDGEPLAELKARHERLVLNELRGHNLRGFEADDVACLVWTQVWKMGRDGKWNANRATYSSDSFVPLLKRICKSRAIDFHRQSQRDRGHREQIVDAFRAHGDDWREALAGPHRAEARAERPEPAGVPVHLQPAVARLPEKLRRVYELHMQGLPVRKIAPEVGCSPSQAAKRLMDAREQLGLPRKTKGR